MKERQCVARKERHNEGTVAPYQTDKYIQIQTQRHLHRYTHFRHDLITPNGCRSTTFAVVVETVEHFGTGSTNGP